jgi:acyl-CoA reductase-like NAD-dependent aldehyde dehydrogenase
MKIMNPATGAVLAEVAADTLKTIRAKYELARAAQPKWAAVPIKKRLAVLQKFRSLLIDRQNLLAKTLTAEVGKPIRQSRNELNGLTGRIDFFLAQTEKALRDEKVFADAKGAMEERIGHVPLGVIANISAWNYPYFVGGNVFVPALAAGNAVLYKPSEFATLTGQHIADLLHEAGVPRNVFVAIIGDGKTGAALLRQPVDGVFFTGSYRTGAAIAASTGRRMVRSTTPASHAARSSASTSTRRSTTSSSRRLSQR